MILIDSENRDQLLPSLEQSICVLCSRWLLYTSSLTVKTVFFFCRAAQIGGL